MRKDLSVMKKVLVTGASRGIGYATVVEFARLGYHVIAVSRGLNGVTFEGLDNITKIECDISQLRNCAALREQIGPIQILINNAGIMHGVSMENYSEELKDSIMKTNLEAPIELIKAFVGDMVKSGTGRIVNNASIAGQIGHPDIWYGISKAGLINVTKSIAKSLGSKGIVVNAVAAGPVETDMLKTIPPERQEAIKSAVYAGRFAHPDEVAKTIIWLATDAPEYINGVCIDINNGAFPR